MLELLAGSAQAATRIYLMRGIGGRMFSSAMDDEAAKLRRHGAIVTVGDWTQWADFAADAAAHPNDRIVLIGHSAGAWGAAQAANTLAARGRRAKVVGIDPLCMAAEVDAAVNAVNFFSTRCGLGGGEMAGARNIDVSGYGKDHIGIAADPRVQSRVLAEALGRL
jgi:pimeloyl-ACP methyl ester carboxylesterase